MTELKRDLLEPERYQYLNQSDSRLYDRYKDVETEEAEIICWLLVDKADTLRGAHCRSHY